MRYWRDEYIERLVTMDKTNPEFDEIFKGIKDISSCIDCKRAQGIE